MEREERTNIVGDTPPVGGNGHSGTSIIAWASTSDAIVPAQLWRDYLSSWIGGSRGQFLISSVRSGIEAPPTRAQRAAFNDPQSEKVTSGGANTTDCTTGGEPCASMSYYGSIDATPLFIMLAGAYFQRTADSETVRGLWPNITAALRWIEEYGDRDKDGFVEYARHNDKVVSSTRAGRTAMTRSSTRMAP